MTQVKPESARKLLVQKGRQMTGAELRYYARVAAGQATPRKPAKGKAK